MGHVRVMIHSFGYAADIVQRHIAETVDFEHLALVDGVVPVDFEHFFHQGRDDIHLIIEKCDDTYAYNISYITDCLVLIPFQFQLVRQAVFRFDARLKPGNMKMVFVEALAQTLKHDGHHSPIHRKILAIFIEYHFAMEIEFHRHQRMVMMFEKPVMSKTSFTRESMLRITMVP